MNGLAIRRGFPRHATFRQRCASGAALARRCIHPAVVLQAACLCFGSTQANAADGKVHFERQIAPLLERHCVRCHAPGNPKGDLSVATVEDLLESGYIVTGEPDSSYLVELITPAGDEDAAMPAEGEPLSNEQVKLIRRWIAEGADWPQEVIVRERSAADASWWSLQPLQPPALPVPDHSRAEQDQNPIDLFIASRLAEQGLNRNPPADRRTLIRRATFDLTGLPPTPEDVDAFVNDDDPRAYERLIDRLLASPHYGERWGRHWLDVVRFGESNGFERNLIINDLWPFRDYVIESLNEDKPFDELIREHLAGDVVAPNDPDVVVGSAFLVAGPYDNVRNRDPVQAAQIRANTIDEMIRATGQAFLGLTIGCARCHDHKFDPIRQRDYYAIYSTFAGVRHGSRVVATRDDKRKHAAKLKPLQRRRAELTAKQQRIRQTILERASAKLDAYRTRWSRPEVDRQGTRETFDPVTAKWVRLVSEGQDVNPGNRNSFAIDEFEIWSVGGAASDTDTNPASERRAGQDRPAERRNVALASAGATATGPSRTIEDFPGAYGPQKAIDGRVGERFLATGGHLTIELPKPTTIDQVVFSSARGEAKPEHRKFIFVGEYRIEVSVDGEHWTTVATSYDRRPVNRAHRDQRLRKLEATTQENEELSRIGRETAAVDREIAAIPPLPKIWVGERVQEDAKGPFHVFVGGSPQRKGDRVVPASLSVLQETESTDGPGRGDSFGYQLPEGTVESLRRMELANWIVHPDNPLTPRVLANRLWHYHFGTGIVDTPSDFGFMGGKPTHPQLLDWLAAELQRHGWRLKPLHKLIMTSATYRQSSQSRERAVRIDADARLLWRYPPRRLSAEEIRDTILRVAGQLRREMGGPGFRLYHFMQDNVCTYVPLDAHGTETYRRAVYHQNARAAGVDLMTEFDQPDCAFSTPRRAETTTPLQSLTMLNHSFTVEMASAMAEKIRRHAGGDPTAQIEHAYRVAFARHPLTQELAMCEPLVNEHGLAALCRVLLNTSELIYVR